MQKDDLYKQIELNHVMSNDTKEFIRKHRTDKAALDLLDKSQEEIQEDIRKKVATLTKEYLKEEYRSIIPDNFEKLVLIEQIAILFEDYINYDTEELETVLQVYRLFTHAGIKINLIQAADIWSDVSDAVCASWLMKSEDDSTWLSILTDWVYR